MKLTFYIVIHMLLEFVSKVVIDNKSASIQLKTWN